VFSLGLVQLNLVPSLCGGASHAPSACSGVRRRRLTNQAHIEAHALDGTGAVSADVGTRVDLGGTGNNFGTSDWQPPACFGFNCTQQYYGDEWIPCNACGVGETEGQVGSCPSCVPSDDGGYDLP
jgi:hypothetical protein